MFALREPGTAALREFMSECAGLSYSYPEVGVTNTGADAPRRYRVDRHRVRLGEGAEVFERCRRALESWGNYRVDWIELCWPHERVREGQPFGLAAWHYGFWSMNVTRVVYVVDQDDGGVRRYGYGHGTLQRHMASGEERFLVEMLADGSVWYDIYAVSRPRHWLAHIARPLMRIVQKKFVRESMEVMRRVARGRERRHYDELRSA